MAGNDLDRQRIIASVFDKRNAESYVAHVKIWEDFPEGEGQKPRYIIISCATDNTGFIHKSKLNPNGSFSVGKTWRLADLRGIDVLSSTSFNITIARTYKWQTENAADQAAFVRAILDLFRTLVDAPLDLFSVNETSTDGDRDYSSVPSPSPTVLSHPSSVLSPLRPRVGRRPSQDNSLHIEIHTDGYLPKATFTANGEYLVVSHYKYDDAQVWRVKDAKQMATIKLPAIWALALSKDDRWIAAGTVSELIVLDAKTHKKVFTHKEALTLSAAVDFSPDSTRLLAGLSDYTATVWEIATRKQVQTLHHLFISAAKYSPEGDQIATANAHSVRVWDSNDGRLLVDIPVEVDRHNNCGLLWFNDHLFVVSDGKIKEFDASSGSPVSQWPVGYSGTTSCISLSQHGEFITYAANDIVTFWDTSTHTQLGLIQHPQNIISIALSPDDCFLAISASGQQGTITIKNLKDIVFPSYYALPFIEITVTAFSFWQHGKLANSEASLTETIFKYPYKNHLTLANRALVRAHLQHWNLAIDDADESIKNHPSVIGYIAKSVALIGEGKKREGCEVFNQVFTHCDRIDVDLLLLIKAVVLFMAGKHADAVLRVGSLIATVKPKSIYYLAYMYLLLGNPCMENGDYNGAIQSFERAQSQMRYYVGPELSTISLVSGWKFDGLDIRIRQRLCEALDAAGRMKDAHEPLLNLVNSLDERVYSSGLTTDWVSDFTRRCLSVQESDSGAASKAVQHDNPPPPKPLLREWTRATLASRSWNDTLSTAAGSIAPRFTMYRAMCECLEAIDQISDATECFNQMVSELTVEADTDGEHARWALDFRQRCASKLEHLGDVAADAQQYAEAITQYSTALSLKPPVPNFFIMRSKMYMAKGLWEDALEDTNQVIALDPMSPWGYQGVLMAWAKVNLSDRSWRNALTTACSFDTLGLKFIVPRFAIYQAICEHLEAIGRITDAIECFHEMASELAQQTDSRQAEWIIDFKSRCVRKLEALGNLAMSDRQQDEAISWYSTALLLEPTDPRALFAERSKARASRGLWEDALNDANEVITRDPSSPLGYERKHIALRGAGRNGDAIAAFEMMLTKMSLSSDSEIRERSRRYVNPAQTEATIRGTIENTIRETPPVLINTDSGRILDKSGQLSSFESRPIFQELVSSMTTAIDRARIEHEVAQYYRYATFSHKWKDNEPPFEKVMHIPVYDLDGSLTHDKLQMFCKTVRDAGLHWAWSDTCCINKADPSVLQEALVSMFQWYQASVMTLVLLCDVSSPSRRGDLVRSIWNTRAWTFQEYHASKVVRFYNKDWTLYRNIDIPNHKESREIISEMEEATGVSARALMALQPGLEDIREKLCLASTRQTTRVEDAAYSLLGIFSLSMSVVYGEGDKALGRLLSQLLASSGDTRVLAWTGKSGSFNSCLPAKIDVFNQLPTSHIPPAITRAEVEVITTELHASLVNLSLATTLYDRLNELRIPLFAGKRMTLPCIVFKLGPLSISRSRSRVFRAQTAALGIVEIKTEEDLSRLDSLCLVHPWIDFLLDRQPVGSMLEMIPEENTDDESSSSSLISELPLFPLHSDATLVALRRQTSQFFPRSEPPFGGRKGTRPGDVISVQSPSEKPLPRLPSYAESFRHRPSYMESLRPPSSISPMDKQMLALRVIARLRQPFGALLLTPSLGNVAAYRRVASESLITVQVEEITPTIFDKLIDGIRVLDVL
ncbi:hypothetical protein OG21DRAFT_1483751 [Imleria badia]|nr:hypothetical protein OG21DRAFT_1483751 [Imleria badia]